MKWKIENLDNYPKDNKHLKIIFTPEIPLMVTKGRDERLPQYWYIEYRCIRTICDIQSSNYWFTFNLPEKGFKTAENAVKEAIKIYKEWLQNQMNRIN